MRILFVSSSSGSRGGGELFLLFLGRALARRGHTVALWCSASPTLDELAESFASVGEVLRAPYANTYDSRLRSLRHCLPHFGTAARARQWAAWRPDVIHLNKQCLEDGLDLVETAAHLNTPGCCTIHITQTAAELNAVAGRLRDRIALRHLRRYRGQLLAISGKRRAELERFIGDGRSVFSIDNGVEIPADAEMQSLRATARAALPGAPRRDQMVVSSVGRVEEQKHPMRFLEMALEIRTRIPDALFYWVGDGRLRPQWDEWVRAHNAADFIFCLGWQKQVAPFLAATDLYLHPARFEGLPFALLEAMAWRLPVVITSQLAAELDFLTERETIIAHDGAHDWLERAVDARQREALARAARAMVEQRFSTDAMAAGYERVYAALRP